MWNMLQGMKGYISWQGWYMENRTDDYHKLCIWMEYALPVVGFLQSCKAMVSPRFRARDTCLGKNYGDPWLPNH